jgi:hypothetical protein
MAPCCQFVEAAISVDRRFVGSSQASTAFAMHGHYAIMDPVSAVMNVAVGSWPCQNALPQKALDEAGCDSSCLFGFDYARIAAISGWMPMMFITRVRL